jgi:hypothetical protein
MYPSGDELFCCSVCVCIRACLCVLLLCSNFWASSPRVSEVKTSLYLYTVVCTFIHNPNWTIFCQDLFAPTTKNPACYPALLFFLCNKLFSPCTKQLPVAYEKVRVYVVNIFLQINNHNQLQSASISNKDQSESALKYFWRYYVHYIV